MSREAGGVRGAAHGAAEVSGELRRPIVAHIDGGRRGPHAARENRGDTTHTYGKESDR
ncbi:hypothetical protein ACFY7Z_12280 [Streptomyces sp. NPDC012623]|uniref:hypothetical protein n=1 Tax=unclassified Streptomyces TaxID=2593676 RepID=UPI00367BC9F7